MLAYGLHAPALGMNFKTYGPVRFRKDPESYFNDFYDDIERRSNHETGGQTFDPDMFNRKCSGLFEELFPEDLRDVFRAMGCRLAYMTLYTEESWIPWELLRFHARNEHGGPEEGRFFCEAFAMTRWIPGIPLVFRFPLENLALVCPESHPPSRTRDITLVPAHDSEIPFYDAELNYICDLADKTRRVTRIPPDLESVKRAMDGGRYDAWHFAGHGRRHGAHPNDDVIRLKSGRDLSARVLAGEGRNFGKSNPLVFFNTCHAGRTGDSLTDIGGWPRQFAHSGAGAFIGALCSIDNEIASKFARRLYDGLIEGKTIGEAVRDARLAVKHFDDVTWLAYTAYGSPLATLGEADDAADKVGSTEDPRIVRRLGRKTGKVFSRGYDPAFFIEALKSRGDDIFLWSEATDHEKNSWPGVIVYSLHSLNERISPGGMLAFLVVILLWTMTNYLMAPMLQWPQGDASDPWTPFVKYALATLATPLIMCLITTPDRFEYKECRPDTTMKRIRHRLLIAEGAYVGFNVFSTSMIFITLIHHYLFETPLSSPAKALLAFIPLLFSHVAARRIPADRFKMYGEDVYTRAPNFFILTVFILLGPFTAAFLYYQNAFLMNPATGIAFAATLGGVAFFMHKKRNGDALSDQLAILLLGGLPLVCILGIYLSSHAPATMEEVAALAVMFTYTLIESLMVATLFIRCKPVVTPAGIMGLSAISIAAILTLTMINVYAGLIFIGSVALVWGAWGRKRLESYFHVHGSFWLLQAVLIGSLYGMLKHSPSIWINMAAAVTLSAALIGWAYGRKMS